MKLTKPISFNITEESDKALAAHCRILMRKRSDVVRDLINTALRESGLLDAKGRRTKEARAK